MTPERPGMRRPRRSSIAAAVAILSLAGATAGEPAGQAPRQSRPQQLAQSCRMLCLDEYVACQRTCDTAPARIYCLHQCQTRLNLCNSSCR